MSEFPETPDTSTSPGTIILASEMSHLALQVAFDTFTSGFADDKFPPDPEVGPKMTAAEAMALDDDEFEEQVMFWEPFEEDSADDLKALILTLAEQIEDAMLAAIKSDRAVRS